MHANIPHATTARPQARMGICKTGIEQAHYQLKHKVQNTAGGN